MNKRYYWIKLKKDFFNQEAIDFLMSQQNGCQYIVLYQMLCLHTVNTNGAMATQIGEIIIPYDAKKIVRDTKYFDFDTVTVALELFKQLGLIYEEENKILHIADYEDLVGSEAANANAQRQKRFRQKQQALQKCYNSVTKNNAYNNALTVTKNNAYNNALTVTKNNVDIDIRDKSIDIDNNNIISNDIICQTQSVRRVVEEWNTLSVFGISQIAKIDSNSKRYKSLVARLNQYGEEQVLKAIDNIRYSDFLQGKHDGKPWQITFDWFVLPNNFPKVLENNYKNAETNFNNGSKNYHAVDADEINAIVEAGFNLAANN